MAPPLPRDPLAVLEAAFLSPAPPSPAQRVGLLNALRDAAPAFRALLSYPGPKASDRTQVEAKEVRLPDMPPITLDDTDVQTARPASELRKGLIAGSPYSAINLGGRVLQQTQVAVPGGTAWLFTRFTHKDPHADGVPPPTSKWGSARPASELRKGLMAGSPYSAMNLGRALQRTQVAVPGAGARLFTRFIHKDAHADGAPPPTSIWGSRKLNDAEKANLYRQLRTIHNKREELYELSASVQKNYSIPSSIGRANKELLRSLSAQVDPRPTDHLWLMFRASRRLNNMLKFSAAVASVYVITAVQFPSGEE